MASGISKSYIVGAVAVLFAYTVGPDVLRCVKTSGILRTASNTTLLRPEDLAIIGHTTFCEDLHYYAPANRIFTACEDSAEPRFRWFPPLANFDDPKAGQDGRASLVVINPETRNSQRLTFENFDSTYISHGIDVISDPSRSDGEAAYIFAVNHAPSPEYLEKRTTAKGPKALSTVEVFYHVIGSMTVKHLRTVEHPLITTPNDIFAVSPTSFYVTNDHYYREGMLRTFEDVYFSAKWSNTIHVSISHITPENDDAKAGVSATVALTGLHNNNGLGHGRSANEALFGSCTSGTLHIGEILDDASIRVTESIEVDSMVDNPSYFSDPYANATFDASGYVLPGAVRGIDIPKTMRDPTAKDGGMVWLVQPTGEEKVGRRWQRRLLFQNDGSLARGMSAAVLVAIDPKLEQGQRKAWLYASGFLSTNTIAVKVDL